MADPIAHRRTFSRNAAVLLIVAAASCGGGSDIPKELDTVRSWTSTMRYAGEAHRGGATTDAYTADLRDAARKALAESRARLANASAQDSATTRLRPAVDSLDAELRRLDHEIHAR